MTELYVMSTADRANRFRKEHPDKTVLTQMAPTFGLRVDTIWIDHDVTQEVIDDLQCRLQPDGEIRYL